MEHIIYRNSCRCVQVCLLNYHPFFFPLTSDGAAWSILRMNLTVLSMKAEMLGNAISHIPFI